MFQSPVATFSTSFLFLTEDQRMGLHQNIEHQSQDMNLVLSTDAKPRLKWTPELHLRFVDAVNQLGGAEKTTPKSLMRVMGIPGLTLYHLKSHLQKYRLGKSQQQQLHSSTNANKKEILCDPDKKDGIESDQDSIGREIQISDGIHNPIDESLKIAQALQMQMEVQRKLHEQIEVQRHLQLRVEAQGKYLQSVLKRAQETLATYTSCPSSSIDLELAKAELSLVVSMVNTESSISGLTEMGGSDFEEDAGQKRKRSIVSSLESSLVASENAAFVEQWNNGSNNQEKRRKWLGAFDHGEGIIDLNIKEVEQVKDL